MRKQNYDQMAKQNLAALVMKCKFPNICFNLYKGSLMFCRGVLVAGVIGYDAYATIDNRHLWFVNLMCKQCSVMILQLAHLF